MASESGRSLTSADASHAIVQSPPSDVGRTDGAGKRVSSPGFRLPLGMALNSKVGKRLLMGEYAWRITPSSLQLDRLSHAVGASSQERPDARDEGHGNRGREQTVVGSSLAAVLGPRALSPFTATSAEIEQVTPNIRRFHSTSPPRSRSSPKTRASSLKRPSASPGTGAAKETQVKPQGSQVVIQRPRIVYPTTPGGTVILPPPLNSQNDKARNLVEPGVHAGPVWTPSVSAGFPSKPPPPPKPSGFSALTDSVQGVHRQVAILLMGRSIRLQQEFMGAPGVGQSPEEPSRASLELPKLERFEPTTSVIVAGAWLASLAPVMASLGPSADRFWSNAKESAQFVYDRWVPSSPLERLHIQADVLADRCCTGRYSRVDQRAVSLLLATERGFEQPQAFGY